MAENEPSSSSTPPSSSLRPTISLPPRSSMETFFTGAPEVSPGPMTLLSNFFSENDPDSDCRSFSQLLSGAGTGTAALDVSVGSTAGGDSGGVDEFNFQFPSGLVISQASTFTIPPGLSPASLLDSPGFFPPAQGQFQRTLAHGTAQATQSHPQQQTQTQYSSISAFPSAPFSYYTSGTTSHQHMPPVQDANMIQESTVLSHPDQRSEPSSFTVDKPSDDGYNWRKYGQKQVKGSDYPRSYYKCTQANCPVKKKVERSIDGQVTEIIYKGQHNHQQPNKCGKDGGNLNGNSELVVEGQNGNFNRLKDQDLSQATAGSSDSEEVGDAETGVDERDGDEPEAKRRNTEIRTSDPTSSHRTVTEPRIIVQTTSEVDLLDDGYRWRKYGQKVVKGNPYPRSYYKCTSQGCNVRKHVERAPSDRKAVITTYEGKHTHDVPAAKTSSHNTANNTQLRTQNGLPMRRTEFLSNDQQQHMALLRFKEEQIT